MVAPRCDAMVQSSQVCYPRQCRRPATWSTLTRDGRTVHECTRHHARDAGVWRMLAPLPWEVASEVRLDNRPPDDGVPDPTPDEADAWYAYHYLGGPNPNEASRD